MKRIFKTILVTTLLIFLHSNQVSAIDEDYFIPYTDTYGYEYDPETGTFIKKEPDPVPVQEHQQSATPDESMTAMQQTVPSAGSSTTNLTTKNSNLGLPLIIAGAFFLLGGFMVFIRRRGNKK